MNERATIKVARTQDYRLKEDIGIGFPITSEEWAVMENMMKNGTAKGGYYRSWQEFVDAHAEYFGKFTMQELVAAIEDARWRRDDAIEYAERTLASDLAALHKKAVIAGLIKEDEPLPGINK